MIQTMERCGVVRLGELRLKEVIGVNNGIRLGYVGDAELDLVHGKILSLMVPGRLRLFGLLGREKPTVIPWYAIQRFGEDTVLVDMEQIGNTGAENRAEAAV